MEPPPLDDLAFLGLTADTDLETLKATRNALLKSFHPDRFQTPQEKAEAHEQAIRINAAFERIRKWLESRAPKEGEAVSDGAQQEAPDNEAEQSRRARAEARRQEEAAWASFARQSAPRNPAPPPPHNPEPEVATVHPPRQWRGPFHVALAVLLVLFGVGIGMQLRTPPVDEPAPPAREEEARRTVPPKPATPSATAPRPTTMPVPVVPKAVGRPGEKFWEANIGEVSLPPVVGGKNWVHVATKDGTVYTFHERSGLLRWKTALGTNVLFMVVPPNGSVVVATADWKVQLLEAATGVKRWQFQDTHRIHALIAGSQGYIYVESMSGRLSALDHARGFQHWAYFGRERTAPPALGVNGTLYVSRTSLVPASPGTFTMKQDLVALNGATGKPLWEYPMGSLSSAATVGPDGTVYVHSHRGVLYALNGTNGALLWQNPVFQGPPKGSPSLTPGGSLIVTDHNGWKTYAIHSSTGAREWEFWWSKLADRRILGSDGTTYLTSGQHLCAVNTAGTKVWEKDLESPILGVASLGATTFATTAKGTLFALDIFSGQLYWNYSLGEGASFSAPPVLTPQQTVLLATTDGKVSALAGGALRDISIRQGTSPRAAK